MKTEQYIFSNKQYINNLLKHDHIYFSQVIEVIKNNVSNDATILDHGCGTGNLIKILEEIGYKNAIGVDLDLQSIQKGRDTLAIKNIYSFSEFNLLNKKFDIVVTNNVIEHVNDIKSYLDELINLLQTGGILVVVTPNYLNPRKYFFYIVYKILNRPLHKTPFNTGNIFSIFFRLLKSIIMTILKLYFNNNTIWKVIPLDPILSVGGDADATWVSNYLDIRNYISSKKNIVELKKQSFKNKITNNIFIARKL